MASRRSHAVLAALGSLVLLAIAAPARAGDETVEVMLDKAKILRMPANATTIVIGNPIIADVTAMKNDGLVVVTGKGYGETNMIFLDAAGVAVQEATIKVINGNGTVTVQRGMDRESYSCQPRCQPTVSLGDADAFIRGASAQITARNSLAVPGH